MALYQLPKKLRTTLKLYIKGAPSQPLVSLLPGIFDTTLERLADPSPSHHILRAPFIRPLLNTKASTRPIFNLLSPAYVPKEEEIAQDSSIQAQLIDFFEEQKHNLQINTHIEEDLPVFVYCQHRQGLLGPQLIINENYNRALNNSSKPAAVAHAISVLCHQLSLMLQARADPHFNVSTSRRPSDLDAGDNNRLKRAAFADFQLEKRGGDYHLAGVLQPSSSEDSEPESTAEIKYYQPRALSQSALTRWHMYWTKPQWDPRATLDFFNMEDTVVWDSIEDVYKKTITTGDETVEVKVPGRRRREISFAFPPTEYEMQQTVSSAEEKSDLVADLLDEEVTGEWEKGSAAARLQARRLEMIDSLSAKDLERDHSSSFKSRGAGFRTQQPRAPPKIRMTGPNMSALSSNRKWGEQTIASPSSPAPAPAGGEASRNGWGAASGSGKSRYSRDKDSKPLYSSSWDSSPKRSSPEARQFGAGQRSRDRGPYRPRK